jgi:tetratricopeptide (TPR) repeat protein
MQANPMLGVLFQQALNAHRAGDLDKACKLYQAVLQMAPGHFDTLHFLGLALADTGQILQGAQFIEKALRLAPASPPALSNLAGLYRQLGRTGEARQVYERALSYHPGFPEALNGLGNLFHQTREFAKALACLDKAIEIQPGFAEAHNNRGNALFALRRLEEAVAAFGQAISLRPNYAEAYNNLGFALVALRRCEEALNAYERALELAPNYARAKLNKGLCHLLMGDYAQGWPLYEYRWADQQRKQKRDFAKPLWLGQEPLAGKSILLHAEQGLGDSIQFCRYVPMLAKLGARVIAEIPASLHTLFKSLTDSIELREEGDPLPSFDVHCPLASLPLAFAIETQSIPKAIPYLAAPPEKILAWESSLGLHAGRPRIGIVWAGSQTDPHRAIAPELLLSRIPAPAMAVAVQKELDSETALRLHRECPELLLCGDSLGDFADTAALLKNLDLLITIDTSVAHLAGALGIRAWVLLHSGSDWRWAINGQTSLWYPSLRLFRQVQAGDWTGLIENQLGPALDTFVNDFQRQ